MDSKILIIYNAILVDSSIENPGLVVVKNGKICGVFLGEVKNSEMAFVIATSVLPKIKGSPVFFDAKGLVLMPSFVDMHVHFRYPGQTQKEDLDSGLRAAAAGGFGTVVTMPNTAPVVSSAKLARQIMSEASEKKLARVFQTVSITKNFEGDDISEIQNLSVEEFPVISEDGREVANSAVMLEGMKAAGKNSIIVSCHCEDPFLAAAARPYRQRALKFMENYNIPAGKVNIVTQNVPDSVNFEIDGCLTAANQLLALAEDTATERNIDRKSTV